jgi:hypothetical protein
MEQRTGAIVLLRRTRINLAFTFVSSKAEQRNIQACCHFNTFTGTTNFLYFPPAMTSCSLSINLTLFQITLRCFLSVLLFFSLLLGFWFNLIPVVHKYSKKNIVLLSVVQSQPTHTLATRNQATGFSSNSHHQAYDRKPLKSNSIYLIRGKIPPSFF